MPIDHQKKGSGSLSIENFSLKDIKSIVGTLKNMILIFFLVFITFVTGFGSVGAYIFHLKESAFFRTALEAEGSIERVQEGISRSTRTQGGTNRTASRTETRTETNYTAHIQYQDKNVNQQRATVSLGRYQTHDVGDHILIAYNPENPSDIRLARSSSSPSTLLTVSKVLGGIFVGSLLCLFLATRGRKSLKE